MIRGSAKGQSTQRARLACVLVAALVLASCGGDDAATEQRIQRERAEAALLAKQEERIKQLERERREARGGSNQQPPVTVNSPPPSPTPAPPATPPGSSAPSDDWPGGSAYTTILASVASESEARRIQAQATARGLDAGVLNSTGYRSLKPGFWVVFSGTSTSKQDADRRTARAKSLGYVEAYPRFVSG